MRAPLPHPQISRRAEGARCCDCFMCSVALYALLLPLVYSACMGQNVTQHSLCRLLRVDIDTRPQQSLFRGISDTAHSHHATGLPSRSQADGGSTAKKQSTEHSKRDDRMLKELQEIAAALKEMRASGTKHPGNAGKNPLTAVYMFTTSASPVIGPRFHPPQVYMTNRLRRTAGTHD